MKTLVLSAVTFLFCVQNAWADTPTGTRNFNEAISDLVYFGGVGHSSGDNRNPLENTALNALCKKGFGDSVFVYAKNLEKLTPATSCGQQTLDYQFIDWRKPEKIMKLIYQAYQNNSGPVYVHCYNGVHASNAIAAVALKQFCGWSTGDAKKWWDKYSDGNEGDVRKWSYKRIEKYNVDPNMKLSPADKNSLCP